MKKGFFLTVVAVFCAAAVSAENFWPNGGMEEGKGSLPAGYVRAGTDTSLLRWGAPAASGEKSIGIVDDSTGGYGSWSSALVKLPAGTVGQSVRLRWVECYNVESGVMRVTVTFCDEAKALIQSATANHLLKGKNAGWNAKTFSPVDMTVKVPANAVTMKIALMSAGANDATGEVWMDDLTVEPVTAAQ